MRACEKCLNNNWKFEKKRDLNFEKNLYTKWIQATCLICGHEVEFGHKTMSMMDKYGHQRFSEKAEYEIRDGKHFLKIGGVFKEVELKRVKGGLKVIERK